MVAKKRLLLFPTLLLTCTHVLCDDNNKGHPEVSFEQKYYAYALGSVARLACSLLSGYQLLGFYKKGVNDPVQADTRNPKRVIIEKYSNSKGRQIHYLEYGRLQENDLGFYECRAKKGNDTKISKTVLYKEVDYSIHFLFQNYEEDIGSDVTLGCYEKKFRRTTFSKLPSTDPISQSLRITITEDEDFYIRNLHIKDLKESDFGDYKCKRNSRNQALTTLKMRPSALLLKQKFYLEIGKAGVVQVTVRGIPKPTVFWEKKMPNGNFKTLVSGKMGSSSNKDYSISSDGSLIISNVLLSHAGEYNLKLKDSKSITKFQKSLSVYTGEKPILVGPKYSKFNVKKGARFQLECTFAGINTSEVIWTYGSSGTVQKGVLSINSASRVNEGIYNCSASNVYGSTTKSFLLEHVIESSNITVNKEYKVQLSKSVQMTCSSQGYPLPTWQWFKKKNGIFNLIFTETAPARTTTRSIVSTKRTSSGVYQCLANYGTVMNGYQITSKGMTKLIIYENAEVRVDKEYKVELTKPVKMRCSSQGHPLPKWQWYKLNKDNTFSVIYNDKDKNPSSESVMDIKVTKMGDAGTYKCLADYGTMTSGLQVTSSDTTKLTIYETCDTATAKTKCAKDQICLNVNYGFRCRCKPGYVFNGNECKTGQIFQIILTFSDSWHPDYSKSSSEAFLIKAKEYESILAAECKENKCNGVTVTSMKKGSVIVTFIVVYPTTLNVDLTHVQAYVKRLQQNPSINITTSPNTPVVKGATLCDIKGKPCGPSSSCSITTDGTTLSCICKVGYKKGSNGNCVLEEGEKKTLKESRNIVPIVASVCVILALALAIVIFIILRKRRTTSRKQSQVPFNVRDPTLDAPMPNTYDSPDAVQTGSHDNNAYEAVTSDVHDHPTYAEVPDKPQNRIRPNNGRFPTLNNNSNNEPVYAMYDIVNGDKAMPEYATVVKPSDLYATLQESDSESTYERWRKPIKEEPFYDLYDSSQLKTTQQEPVYAIYGDGH